MQKTPLTWNQTPAVAVEIRQPIAATAWTTEAASPARPRRMRVALPTLPRRASCVTRRALLAALREAELAAWQASGGDAWHRAQSF